MGKRRAEAVARKEGGVMLGIVQGIAFFALITGMLAYSTWAESWLRHAPRTSPDEVQPSRIDPSQTGW
jgi:hypothetical protein